VPHNPLRRAPNVPADVLARVSLGRGDKVLAAAVADDGTWLLGTRDALLVVPLQPSGSASAAVESGSAALGSVLPWQRIETVDWDRDAGRLTVAEVGDFGQVRPSYSFEIDDPGLLAQLVRERVTASVVLQRRVAVAGGKGLNVVARRAPRSRGSITWAYEFDPGVDPDDPEVTQAARRGLESAAEELGM